MNPTVGVRHHQTETTPVDGDDKRLGGILLIECLPVQRGCSNGGPAGKRPVIPQVFFMVQLGLEQEEDACKRECSDSIEEKRNHYRLVE